MVIIIAKPTKVDLVLNRNKEIVPNNKIKEQKNLTKILL